jgi:predicted nucleotidyltransferase
MTFGLKDGVIRLIREILQRYPEVEQALIYGSRALGNFRTGSDIDLTLKGGSDLTFEVLRRIMADLDETFLPYTIDLSIYKHISDPDMIAHIDQVGVSFYEKG